MNNQSEMIAKCHSLISEIDKKYSIFIKIFREHHQGKITQQDMLNKMSEIVNTMDDDTMREYNEMAKMYSMSNCGWDSYETGRIVHKLLLNKWYPEKL